MKITKRQLRRIIREATGQHEYRPWFRKPPKLPKDEWKIGDKVVANGYPGVIEDVGDDGMVEVRLKRGVIAVAGSTIVRQHGEPPLNQHFRESWYPHDQRDEDERMESSLGSFPPHWDTADMDDWQDGYEAGLRGSEIIRGEMGDPWKIGYDVGVENSDLPHVRRR